MEAEKHDLTSGIVTVKLEEVAEVATTLHPLPGQIEVVSTPKGAPILLDGKGTGRTTDAVFEREAGKVKVELRLRGYRNIEKEVEVFPADYSKLEITLEKGEAPKSEAKSTSDRIINNTVIQKGEAPKSEAKATLDRIINNTGMQLVLIQPGRFRMGTEKDRMALANERPSHLVEIELPFYFGSYPVTQAEWQAVTGINPVNFKGARHPVAWVSWNDAQEFVKKLNYKEGTNKYRLPTEAEWEYACRAGNNGRWCFGDDSSELKQYAWYESNSGQKTHPVGELKANSWGLHDVHGNVWEWCQDEYEEYGTTNSENGGKSFVLFGGTAAMIQAIKKGHPNSSKVMRGGCWFCNATLCRSATRGSGDPTARNEGVGLRIVRSL
jgi:formylglycine-generating enzyme required for sulfatase activity